MDIVLLAGLWLDATAWNDVVPRLDALGHRPNAVSLPGQGAPPAHATLEDQRAAVVAAVDAAQAPVLVVGHSAASTLAWMAADTRPEKVGRVVMIGGFPSPDGDTYADYFPPADGVVVFPGWEAFDGPTSADLDGPTREAIASEMIAVSEAVTKGTVHLSDDRRFEVPVTILCPEFSCAQAKEWVDGGELPELARARHVDYVDINSGHWPMFSRPAELAAILDRIATER